jgi:hypothetical protein
VRIACARRVGRDAQVLAHHRRVLRLAADERARQHGGRLGHLLVRTRLPESSSASRSASLQALELLLVLHQLERGEREQAEAVHHRLALRVVGQRLLVLVGRHRRHWWQQLSEMLRSLSSWLRINANSGRWNASLLADAAFLAARS